MNDEIRCELSLTWHFRTMLSSSRNTGGEISVRVVVSVVITFTVCGAIALWMVNRCINGESWFPQVRKSPSAGLELKTPPPKRPLSYPADTVTAVAVKAHFEIDKTENCSGCHEVLDATATPPTVNRLLSFTACLACHPANVFAVTHGHVFEPLQDCELCHALHGSTIEGKGLLSAPRDVLCNACHDGDH